ncbi:MAG: hypothetical protein EOO43_24695 [Flavobacterium sp.]|nr:MAG: hypothetical protein EOO43_24695 [Flavobacterium sp.]
MPKISQLQRSPDSEEIITDVQCFCHYNHTEHNEVTYAEHAVNSRIPNSAVIFFGSFTSECTEHCFNHLTEDKLPKLINHWYNLDRSKNDEGERKSSTVLLKERLEFWQTRRLEANYQSSELFDEAKLKWKFLSPILKESNLHAAEHIWTKLYLLGTSFGKIKKKIKELSLNEAATDFIYDDSNPAAEKIQEMARVEHRRWCAERLLEGFLSFHDIYPELVISEVFPETISRWNDKNKLFKNYYLNQKQHLDLLSFDDLYTGKLILRTSGDENLKQTYYDEKIKDISQIEAIPYLLSGAY